MPQLSLFGEVSVDHVVNVASVPQRSPFRYPGGKTWLVPRVRQWLRSSAVRPTEFIEPFAGGGIISLSVAFERLADHVTMVELDDEVAAVWKTIIYGDGDALVRQIVAFDCTAENARDVLAKPATADGDKAFQTLLKNRVYHGGILAPGSSMIKYGENGRGISSRWYPETLRRRILNIMEIRDRITFIEGDGMQVLEENVDRIDATFFIDPPYTAGGKRAGKRLYRHFDLDHEELFVRAKALRGEFLMTYDNAEQIRQMARLHSFETAIVAMQNTHLTRMTELVVGRNLSWIRHSF